MTRDQFVQQVQNSIKKYGFDNDLLNIFKKLINKNKDFYKDIENLNGFDWYQTLLNKNSIKFNDQDLEYLISPDFWNRNGGEFVYTAKILPKIREKDRLAYQTIIKDNKILPAGLDEKDRQNPKANTIWNVAEQIDSGENSDEDEITERTKSYEFDLTDDKIQKALMDISKASFGSTEFTKLSKKELETLRRFIKRILKKY